MPSCVPVAPAPRCGSAACAFVDASCSLGEMESRQQRPAFSARALPEPPGGGGCEISAVGATDAQNCFVAHIAGTGFWYLDASRGRKAGQIWTPAGRFKSDVNGARGLYFRHVDVGTDEGGEVREARVAFVEATQPQSFVCVRLAPVPAVREMDADGSKAASEAEAVVIARTSLADEVVSATVGGATTGGVVALAFASGSLRCYDPGTGKVVGKGLKLELSSGGDRATALADTSTALTRLSTNNFVLVRGVKPGALEAEYFLVSFNAETRRLELLQRNTLRIPEMSAAPLLAGSVAGSLRGAAAVADGGCGKDARDERLLLCWGAGAAAPSDAPQQPKRFVYASASGLDSDSPVMMPLFRVAAGPVTSSVASAPSPRHWFATQGYLAEIASEAEGEALQLILRDSRFGMQVASGSATPSRERGSGGSGGGRSGAGKRGAAAPAPTLGVPLVATSEDVSVLATRGGGTFALHWDLPSFSLQMVLGSAAPSIPAVVGGRAATDGSSEELAPLRDAVAGKRSRDDPAVQALFSAKRRATTEKAWSAELRGRRWRLSPELVDSIVSHGSWAAARALLALPELDEALAVRLLAARPQLLTRVVRRARAPERLGAALRDHLPASQLKDTLEVLRVWLDSYAEFPEEELRQAVPDMPRPAETVQFLSSLAEGCLPSLARIDSELIDQIVDGLTRLQGDAIRTEKLYGSLRAAVQSGKSFRGANATTNKSVEAMLLPL